MLLFDHPHFLIAYKPAGEHFHSQEGRAGFIASLSQELGIALYSVHRLDTITSGLLLIAKDSRSAARLSALFATRQIEKYYIALSTRPPKKKQGWIKGDMTKGRNGSYKLLTSMERPAITQFVSTSVRVHERGFLIKPHTGKTHQIRVALKALGSPIAGDLRYAHAIEARQEDRGYLHAYALRFVWEGETIMCVTPPREGVRFESEAMRTALIRWAKPWEFFS